MQVPRRPLTVYLHIGPPKTGTTYLQDVLWQNRRILRQRDVDFPGSRRVEHFHAASDLRGVEFGGYHNPQVPGAWLRLAEKTLASTRRKALISHEMLAGATDVQVEHAVSSLRPATLHVICGARDLARQLPAVWQESLKNRRSRSYDSFLDTALQRRWSGGQRGGFWRSQDLIASLRRWAAVLPAEHIHVVTLPPAGAPSTTLWERFCAALEIDAADVELPAVRVNGSLSPEDAEVLRRLNEVLPEELSWPAYEEQIKGRFNERANAAASRTRLTVPERYREAVNARAAELTAELAEAGYHVVGDLDELIPAPSSFGTPTEVPPDKVTDAAVEILAGVLTEPDRLGHRSLAVARGLLTRLRRG